MEENWLVHISWLRVVAISGHNLTQIGIIIPILRSTVRLDFHIKIPNMDRYRKPGIKKTSSPIASDVLGKDIRMSTQAYMHY